jgi:bacterioferritin-associated ferredoxin
MYICICKGITEKQVQDAIAVRQNSGTKEILKSLGIGSDCGTCIEDAIQILIQENCNNQSPRLNDSSNNS